MSTATIDIKSKTTIQVRFAFTPDFIAAGANMVTQALSTCPGAPQHIAKARVARRRNRERGIDKFILGSGCEADIDEWEAMRIRWHVIESPVYVFIGSRCEVHVTADLTPAQESWLRDHLLLDETEPDAGTGGTVLSIDGGAWRDGRGWTPYSAVQIDLC